MLQLWSESTVNPMDAGPEVDNAAITSKLSFKGQITVASTNKYIYT